MKPIPNSTKTILASGSQTRFLMLKRAGVEFEQIKSTVDEDAIKLEKPGLTALELGLELASAKALDVSAKYPEALVIGADQVCEFNSEFLDKPGSKENCILHLRKLSGQTHYQNCSCALALNGKIIWSHSAQAELKMRVLTDDEILAYVELENPIHSCGSYMFEKNGHKLFETVTGEEDVILGLPLKELVKQLSKLI